MARDGLVIERGKQQFHSKPRVVESLQRAADFRPYDYGLVTVKGFDTADLAEEWALAGPPASVISFQNGLGNEAVLGERLPDSRILAGTVTAACRIASPGRVEVGAKGGIGLAGSALELRDLMQGFAASGCKVRRVEDAASLKWSKLLLNMLGAATCAILAWPPARVFENPRLFGIERAAWREALAVMDALGIRPARLPDYPVPIYAGLARHLSEDWLYRIMAPQLARGRGDRLPGPAADLASGRPRTEIELLNGAVAAAAAQAGIMAPVNAQLAQLVAAMAAGQRDRLDFAGKPEALLDELSPILSEVDSPSGGWS
jgi:2-dehydropantoate 2-reductase